MDGGRGGRPMSRLSSLLPLWEKVACKARRMRGLYPRRQTPHPSAMLRIASTLSHKRRGKEIELASLKRRRQFLRAGLVAVEIHSLVGHRQQFRYRIVAD